MQLEKCKLDVIFLTKCKTFGVIPKFLRFRLYKRSLHTTCFYKSWQNKLLNSELQSKGSNLGIQLNSLYAEIKLQFPLFTALAIKNFFCDKASKETVDTKKIHDRKLRAIGVHHDLSPCDPSAVVHNHSGVILSKLRTLLAFGLEFCLPVYKLN